MVFSHVLIEWYKANKRDLPWRKTSDAYKIWVSEVILQQTRVAQGLGYYNRFIEEFPSVQELAQSNIDRVLKVWQGLGYYTRARNMHKTANYIVDVLDGVFPNTYEELLKLKGIGDYTASAVAAFAFNQKVAAVDGNVYRIFSRLFCIDTPIDTTKGKNELKELAFSMVDDVHPGIYNQAIMDFGGLICTPKNPKCYECPVLEFCTAFRNKRVDELPVKIKKVKQTERYFTYVIPVRDGKTYITKRTSKDIWHSLYEFPLIESEQQLDVSFIGETSGWRELFGNSKVDVVYVSPVKKYLLSHQRIFARFVVAEIIGMSEALNRGYSEIDSDDLGNYSTPKLIENFIAAEPLANYFKKKMD